MFNKMIDSLYEYFEFELPSILKKLPLNREGKIAIYGIGIHTDRLLQRYVLDVGEIKADLVFIDSRKKSLTDKYQGYDVYNVADIGNIGLNGIIISSSLYEEEMYKAVTQLYGTQIPIYRFYEDGRRDIFLFKGIYLECRVSDMPRLKVDYADFWQTFNKYEHHGIIRRLSSKYKLEISDTPDILICSYFGEKHKDYEGCKKLFLETEPYPLDLWADYDYGMGYHYYDNPKYLHINLMKPRVGLENRDKFKDKSLAKRKFCNFVYSNENRGEGALFRKHFCMELDQYKHVDCPGKVLNNMKNMIGDRNAQSWCEDKIEFIRKYKFTIAFENHMIDGYTTEKLWHSFMAGSIPIYWGNPRISEEIEKDAFINCNDYDNDFEAVINRVKEIDNDDEYYMYMLTKNPLKSSYADVSDQQIMNFFEKIIKE